MYTNEEFAIELDGTDASLIITNSEDGAVAFDSVLWRGDNRFSVEVYIKPYTIAGNQPVFYQPSEGVGAAVGTAGYDGIYIMVEEGEVLFFTMVNGAIAQITRTQSVSATVKTIKANEWQLITATYDQTSASISVDGVAKPVNQGTSTVSTVNGFGSAFLLEQSTKPVYIGYYAFDGYFSGLVGE
eukprot:2866597-Pyramimonas_sp.AAC.1